MPTFPALDSVFEVPLYLDCGATFLWAVTGALMAARRGYDAAGITALALVSATGGGLLRDGLFLQDGPPRLLRTPVYLVVVAVAALLVLAAGRGVQRLPWLGRVAGIADALGMGAYAVVGMQLALVAGISVPGVVLVGVVNAVGGGLLRDVLMRQEPVLFQPGTFQGVAALAGCLMYVALVHLGHVPPLIAAWAAIALIFIVRSASVRFNWTTRPLRGVYEPPE